MLSRIFTFVLIAMLPSVASASPVALSLQVTDGVSEEITLIGSQARFVDELDFVANGAPNTDDGVASLSSSGDFSTLDWTGVTLDDVEWRPDGAGTFTRMRFYRGAAWMEQPSLFLVFQLDQFGNYLFELPFVVFAGSDDVWSIFDYAFIRRFVARQVTTGCVAVDDCSTATGYTTQGLVQLRQAQHSQLGARTISSAASTLRVLWSADLTHFRDLPVQHVAPDEAEYAYGFQSDIEVLTPPANGSFYVPGEAIDFKVNFTDGEGAPLDEAGALPTYAQFLSGAVESGLRYLDILLNSTTYYALKHREGNILLAMGGPTDALKVTDYVVPLSDFFLPQTQSAFTADDGFAAVVTGVPPLAITFGGLLDPALWNAPVTNEATLTVPNDALPGTYLVTVKARRRYAGEAINTGDVIRIQIGTTDETAWVPTTQGCTTCHSGATALGNILHGIGDRESCLAGCHTAIEIEPDVALDYRVHFVHTRSNRYPGDPDDCLVCHVEYPDDIPRGYPGFVYPFD